MIDQESADLKVSVGVNGGALIGGINFVRHSESEVWI